MSRPLLTGEAAEANRRWGTFFEGLALGSILLLAAYLRLANNAVNPGWHSDEGTIVNIAQNMMQGRLQDFALTRSTLLAARMPLYPFLAGVWFRLTGPGIPSLRLLSGGLGVVSCAGLYGAVRGSLGRQRNVLALVAALVLAIYPAAVVYSRLGFSYNLSAPLVLAGLWGVWAYMSRGEGRGLALAALSIGIGLVTDVMMMVFLAALAVLVSLRGKRDLLWSLGLALLPIVIYAATMLISDSDAFIFDLSFTASRLGAIPLWAQPGVLALNLATLIGSDPWIALALVGMFLLRPPKWRSLVLFLFLFPLIAIGRSTGLAGLRKYYLIPILPLVALGVASLLVYGIPAVLQTLSQAIGEAFERWGWRGVSPASAWWRRRAVNWSSILLVFLIALSPLLVVTVKSVWETRSGFGSEQDDLLIDPNTAQIAAEYLRAHRHPDDLVLASPAFAWQISGPVADFQQAVSSAGGTTIDYPRIVPADRFAYDLGIDQVGYVVVDRIWDNWAAVYMPDVMQLQREVEKWPLVYSIGEFRIYENPWR